MAIKRVIWSSDVDTSDEAQCAPLLNAIYEGKNIGEIKAKIRRYSRSLLPCVADVYGWPVAGRRKEAA